MGSRGHAVRPCCPRVGQSPATTTPPARTVLTATPAAAGPVSDRTPSTVFFFFFFLLRRIETNSLWQKEIVAGGLKPTLSSSYHCLI